MEFEVALAAVRVEIDRRLDGQLVVPPGFLDEHLCEHSQVRSLLDDKTRIRLVRHLETIYGTQQGTGHILRGDFKEWYPARKPDLEFYYWRRLQIYWMRFSNLPVRSIRSQDAVTDEILGLLGDPRDESDWRRRGLVMGHVQSGKTTNYSALITKAADAGYRIIIVLAGLLVGVGTRIANGCTSGHGVCGISRLSPRGIVATVIYILAGALTLLALRHGLGLI
jgi:hypothetical protein